MHPAQRALWERGGVLSPPSENPPLPLSFLTSPSFPTSQETVLPHYDIFPLVGIFHTFPILPNKYPLQWVLLQSVFSFKLLQIGTFVLFPGIP